MRDSGGATPGGQLVLLIAESFRFALPVHFFGRFDIMRGFCCVSIKQVSIQGFGSRDLGRVWDPDPVHFTPPPSKQDPVPE